MRLNFDKTGSGPALIIIHGLFGSANNFRTLAKKYADYYTVYCLDLRNHGASPHNDDVSLAAMAADVIAFMNEQDIAQTAIMGHSLGGKVAMQTALTFPDRISKLVVGDIAPVEYPHHHDRIFDGLDAVSHASVTSRKEAEHILEAYVDIPQVRLFLLTNLVRNQDKSLVWRINVAGLKYGYNHIAGPPEGKPYKGPSLFIRGGLSDYVREELFPVIYHLFPKAEIITLAGTGHWLHAEKPQEYTKITLKFLGAS